MLSLQSHFSRCICFHSIISSVLHEVQKNQLVTFIFISLINDESFLSIILIIREHIHISSSFTSMHEKKVRKMSSSDTYVHYSIFLPLNQQVIIIIIFAFFFLRQSMTFYTFFDSFSDFVDSFSLVITNMCTGWIPFHLCMFCKTQTR